MKKSESIKTLIIIGVCALLGAGTGVRAEELQVKPMNEKYIEWLNLPEEERNEAISPPVYVKNLEGNSKNTAYYKLVKASSSYNFRDTYPTLKVKNQMQTPSCWAFAATTVLESYQLTKNKTVEYSPRHMEYATSRNLADGVNPNGFYRTIFSGGNYDLVSAYLTSGQGPIYETDMPFQNNTNNTTLASINKEARAQLEEFIYFPSIYKVNTNGTIKYYNGQTANGTKEYSIDEVQEIRNQIKEHIMQYGGVGAYTYSGSNSEQYYSNPNSYINSNAYYCDNSNIQPDHAITIIGWDDNYSVNNFSSYHRPSSPGAWLVQNSWGADKFNNGLLYISYEDVFIEQQIFGVRDVSEKDYDDIYQYDPLGRTIHMYQSAQTYMANVFEKGNTTKYLTEIGFYTNGLSSSQYEIYINSEDGELNKIKLDKVKTVSGTNSDYITVHLDNPVKLSGNKFAIAIKFDSSQGAVEIPIEAKCNGTPWATASSNAGESFRSVNGTSWTDLKSETLMGAFSDINACIKGFTTNNSNYSVLLSSSVYDTDLAGRTIKKISPNTTLQKLKEKLTTNGTIRVYNENGNDISDATQITTGMKLKTVENGEKFDVVVTGDVNGDGKVTSTDLIKIKKSVTDIEKLSGVYEMAGDVDFSGKITTTDITNEKKAICDLISF